MDIFYSGRGQKWHNFGPPTPLLLSTWLLNDPLSSKMYISFMSEHLLESTLGLFLHLWLKIAQTDLY